MQWREEKSKAKGKIGRKSKEEKENGAKGKRNEKENRGKERK